MIKHKYQLTFLSTELGQPVQFEKLYNSINNIELVPKSGKQYDLIVGIQTNKSIEDSFEEADLKVNDLVYRLSVLDKQVTNLEYVGGI